MSYIDPDVAALFRGPVNLGVFWRLGTDPALHLWMGIHEVPIGIPSLDEDGTTYLGAGRLIDIPELELLINGIADKVDFSLSGVDSAFLAQLDASAPKVAGALCTVGFAPLDERYQPMTSIIPIWCGTADFWTMQRDPASEIGGSPVQRITLSVGAGDTSRANPKLKTFTDAEQRRVSPTDRFFDRVIRYVQTYIVPWPRF